MNSIDIKKIIDKCSPDIVFLLGPTASGKTALSLEIASAIESEIVSIDSRMIYKEMDIGTSKPSIEERKGIKHHLIDIINPDEDFSVSDYKMLAYNKIEKIKENSKLPFFVGGTMMYIDAVCENWIFGGKKPNLLLRKEFDEFSTDELYDKLKILDPVSASRISSKNRRHIIRPLEISIQFGKPFSEIKNIGKKIYKTLKIGISVDREELYKKINDRVLAQIDNGLVEETKRLYEKYNFDLPSMTGLGYKQIGLFLRNEISLDEAIEMLMRDTRHFAKRQLTWWKKDNEIVWI